MAEPEPCFQNLSAEDAARQVDDYFRSFPWESTLDPQRATAEQYLEALCDACDPVSVSVPSSGP